MCVRWYSVGRTDGQTDATQLSVCVCVGICVLACVFVVFLPRKKKNSLLLFFSAAAAGERAGERGSAALLRLDPGELVRVIDHILALVLIDLLLDKQQ